MDVVFVFAGANRDNINKEIEVALGISKQFHVAPSSLSVGALIVKRFGDVHELLDLSTAKPSKQQIIKNLAPYRYSIETPDREISDRTEKDIMKMFNESPREFASKSVVFVVDSRKNYFLNFENLKERFDELGINVVVVVIASDNQDAVVPTYGNSYGADNLVILKKKEKKDGGDGNDEDEDPSEEIVKKTLRGEELFIVQSIKLQIFSFLHVLEIY